MTGKIAPPPPSIALPPGTTNPLSVCAREQGSDAFGSILQQFYDAGSGMAEALGKASGSNDAVADVFNADGFFARLEAAIDKRLEAASANKHELYQGSPRIPEVASGPQSTATGDKHGNGVIASPSISPGSTDLAAPQRQTMVGPMRNHPVSSIDSTPPTELRPVHQPTAASTTSLRTGQSERGGRAQPQGALYTKMAFKVLIDGASIHVVGPIIAIAPDEEARLVEQLADLLIEHGFSPSNVRVNGHLLAPRRGVLR